LTFNLAFP